MVVTVVLCLLGFLVWPAISSSYPALRALNVILMIVCAWLLFDSRRRLALLRGWSRRGSGGLILWIGFVAFMGLMALQGSRDAKEAARADAAKQASLYQSQLAVLQRLDRAGADPIKGYESAQAARTAFQTDLHANSKYQPLAALADKVMLKDKAAYAQHLADEASAAVRAKDFPKAQTLLEQALSLAPQLPGAAQELADIKDRAAQMIAERRSQPSLDAAEANLAKANDAMKSGDAPNADQILTAALGALDKVPAEDRPYLKWAEVRGKIATREGQIAGEVQKEKDRQAKEALEAAALKSACGPSPLQSIADGEIPAATVYLKESANDPDSIEVTDCTPPQLTKEYCWLTTCKVRGKNAFGAKVLNIMRFSIGANPDVEGFGRVLSAKTL